MRRLVVGIALGLGCLVLLFLLWPPHGNRVTFRVWVGSVETPMTCTLTDAVPFCRDTRHAVILPAEQLHMLRIVVRRPAL